MHLFAGEKKNANVEVVLLQADMATALEAIGRQFADLTYNVLDSHAPDQLPFDRDQLPFDRDQVVWGTRVELERTRCGTRAGLVCEQVCGTSFSFFLRVQRVHGVRHI